MMTMESKQMHRYYTLWRRLDAMYAAWAKRHHISYYELLILYSLWNEQKSYTQKALCEEWNLPKQTLHSILQQMHRQGWLSIQIAEWDHRCRQICLSEAGRQFAAVIIPKLQQHECMTLQQMGAAAMEGMLTGMQAFIEAFEESEAHA